MGQFLRRQFLMAASALVVAPRTGRAQHAERSRRIGTLDGSSAAARGENWGTFHRRMRELGYVEGPGYAVEKRWAHGDASKLPALAAELVALKPDVIVTGGTPAALAAKKATTVIPVVFCGVTDPVGSGLVRSLARPGGNLTGMANLNEEVIGKWVELMRSIAPGVKALAFVTDRGNLSAMGVFEKLRDEARRVGVDVRVFDASRPEIVADTFHVIEAERLDGVIVSAAGRMLGHRQSIADAIARLRLPAVFATPKYPEVGGLLSYSADHLALWARAAEKVHRVLEGTKPAEIPVEQASTFLLVVNSRAAKSMGITIPQLILLRADRVIE
jgi:putative tryptophan/tyrosine transport system substrate-binding protein